MLSIEDYNRLQSSVADASAQLSEAQRRVTDLESALIRLLDSTAEPMKYHPMARQYEMAAIVARAALRVETKNG